MKMDQISANLLLTGKTGLYAIRLVAGRPAQTLTGKQHKGLLFTEGQTFCYVVVGLYVTKQANTPCRDWRNRLYCCWRLPGNCGYNAC